MQHREPRSWRGFLVPMPDPTPTSRYARPPGTGPRSTRVTNLELFYDLVFVFAITQVSHLLLEELTWANAGRATVVLLAVWWSWNYTAWVTNELDPEATVVRLMIVALMLGSLLLAVAIPEAFGGRALLFAGSYVAIQVGRHTFLAFVAGGKDTVQRRRAVPILVWFIAAGIFWIAGALADGEARTILWLIALAIDYVAPLVTFWLPVRVHIGMDAWNVGTSHFAERFQLFVIIALGESIVLTGETTSHLHLDAARIGAFATAFLATAAFWWLYFNYVATIAERRLELAANRTIVARDAYTYLHVVMIAGVILSAVGDELVIAHPTEMLSTAEILAVVGGPVLYLAAHVLFRWRIAGTFGLRRAVGMVACVAAIAVGLVAPALVLGATLLAILVAVIGAEQYMGRRRAQRGDPTPMEVLEAEFGTP
jgi:low temperature requirement protein LtrA